MSPAEDTDSLAFIRDCEGQMSDKRRVTTAKGCVIADGFQARNLENNRGQNKRREKE